MRKVTATLSGIGIGAALMYLFEPKNGLPRRALMRDKATAGLSYITKRAFSQKMADLNENKKVLLSGRKTGLSDISGKDNKIVYSNSKINRYARYAKHVVRAISTDHPLLVHIIPMRRCNLSCTYCNEYDKTSEPVAIDVMLERIDKLAELGSSIITISGGEPMLHPQIYEIIARIRYHGMIAGLISNGYYFQPDKIKKLNEAGLDELQISIDNVESDVVSRKSLKVLDSKLKNLAEQARFNININSVLGSGVTNPADALTIAIRARELGFASTVGIIHNEDGLLKRGLNDHEKEIYKQIKNLPQKSYAVFNGFQDKLVKGEELEWRCRAGARYLYVDEAGFVSWCSQQRGTPGIPLEEYTKEDIRREYITEKWCATTCTIQCVHIISKLDSWRLWDSQTPPDDYNKRRPEKNLK